LCSVSGFLPELALYLCGGKPSHLYSRVAIRYGPFLFRGFTESLTVLLISTRTHANWYNAYLSSEAISEEAPHSNDNLWLLQSLL
jgi:hypothetical protein